MSAPITEGYVPGLIGRVVELHGLYYAREWGFGVFFEAKVAAGLAEFLGRYDPTRDGIWSASIDGRIEGSITIDGKDSAGAGAHLRWFILSDVARGQGVGRALLDRAIAFCRERNHPRVYLWTFAGLDAARHLYEQAGFHLVEELDQRQWGKTMREQRFVLDL
ncbi:MAG: GNAT family N-acetyltransferase [Alphaproteobacteria bacterium]|nr:GNAT family N-acetyltransferase [Alphaproteobacteria bacterium]